MAPVVLGDKAAIELRRLENLCDFKTACFDFSDGKPFFGDTTNRKTVDF